MLKCMYSHWIVQLPSHVPSMNDIGRRRSGGEADETFDGADTVAATCDEVPVSSSFDITPPMATAVVVIVIVLPSIVDHRRRRPRPPPPAHTLILECETRPREATRTTTTARNQSCMGHCRRRIEDSRHQSLPPPRPLSRHQRRNSRHVSKSGGGQADAGTRSKSVPPPPARKAAPLVFFSMVRVTAPLALPRGSSEGSLSQLWNSTVDRRRRSGHDRG